MEHSNRALAHFERMQEMEFMDAGRLVALGEVENLLNFQRYNNLLVYHDPTFDPTYDLTTNKLPYRVLNFHYLLFDLC